MSLEHNLDQTAENQFGAERDGEERFDTTGSYQTYVRIRTNGIPKTTRLEDVVS